MTAMPAEVKVEEVLTRRITIQRKMDLYSPRGEEVARAKRVGSHKGRAFGFGLFLLKGPIKQVDGELKHREDYTRIFPPFWSFTFG